MPLLAAHHIPIPTKDLLSWMLDNPPYDEDAPIYIDAGYPSRSVSCRQARTMIRKLAAGLRRAGVRRGECVCVGAFNDIYYPILFLGIVAAGGIAGGTNPSYTPYELAHAIRTAHIKYFIAEPAVLPNVLAAAKECGIPPSHIFAFDVLGQGRIPSGEIKSWTTLMEHGECDWERFDDLKRSEGTAIARLFSSGTTGVAKALDMSCYNFVAQHTLVMEYRPRPYQVRRLICNPMFHVSQVPRAHTSPLRGGIVTHIMRRFDLEPWLQNIERFQITEVNMVPAMVVKILTSGLLSKYSLATIRNAWTGSAPLDKSLQARFKAHMRHDAPFNQVWGMSETSCICTMLYYPDQDDTGSVGPMLPNVDAKVVDEDGRDVTGDGVRGELCVRGPIIVRRYFENEVANKRDWDADGFFHTGDVASCDTRTGLWYIVDRKKVGLSSPATIRKSSETKMTIAQELIKVRGFQVAPAEIEGVLLHHPNVMDAAVIGIQNSIEDSELPRAYVVARPGVTVTEQEVRDYARERLARYKNLDGGIKFVESIPKNASGKILKNQLREQARREVGSRL